MKGKPRRSKKREQLQQAVGELVQLRKAEMMEVEWEKEEKRYSRVSSEIEA